MVYMLIGHPLISLKYVTVNEAGDVNLAGNVNIVDNVN